MEDISVVHLPVKFHDDLSSIWEVIKLQNLKMTIFGHFWAPLGHELRPASTEKWPRWGSNLIFHVWPFVEHVYDQKWMAQLPFTSFNPRKTTENKNADTLSLPNRADVKCLCDRKDICKVSKAHLTAIPGSPLRPVHAEEYSHIVFRFNKYKRVYRTKTQC